ncbi:beta tubulin [Acuticoccus sediminis]|uniref:Beta tubulin n=1 Tax=Acuticoccus sediminis TaxID=2184697 RepID=A0A8B2NHG2_9HYPH|nr:DUF2163 domain-containing protein [Acuticoccus sediminis]RAH98782.1 beta tubulin [Acuticoccus sediminis]
MREIPSALQAHLDSGVVTVCRCWRLARTDGVVIGFTDHDQAVVFDGVTHSAMSGLESSGDVTRTGLGVGGLEVAGALSSAGLDAAELVGGKYDFAKLTLWLVNWADVSQRVVMREGTLGEVTRADGAFRAEVRGPAQSLETVRGRVYTLTCDADLGDGRCRVDLAALAWSATVVAVDGTRLTVSGIGDLADGALANGVAEMASGADLGSRAAIVRHSGAGEVSVVDLRSAFLSVVAGDTVLVTPGCDKRFATCRDIFANVVNYQGFPHLPGNDRAFAYARASA